MQKMLEKLVEGVYDWRPHSISPESNVSSADITDWSEVRFVGPGVDLMRLVRSMEPLVNDDVTEHMFDDDIILVVDGSGTLVYKPLDVGEAALMWCHWKKTNMTRWYIVTDMAGWVLFVSPCYPGKIDDTKALSFTAFKE